MDITSWKLVFDKENASSGQTEWTTAVPDNVVEVTVPGIAQMTFPGCFGVFLYYARIEAGQVPLPEYRCRLFFGAVCYRAQVWVNGRFVGQHDGGETPFDFDITEALDETGTGILAVRVVNPEGRENPQLDDLDFFELPLSARTNPFHSGVSLNFSGIISRVSAEWVPPVRLSDWQVYANWKTAVIDINLEVCSDKAEEVDAFVRISSSRWHDGKEFQETSQVFRIKNGGQVIHLQLPCRHFAWWSPDEPNLYLVTAEITTDFGRSVKTVRTGFRDFRVANGFFRLNGRRIFLRSTHTGAHFPAGWAAPVFPEMTRQDMVMAKAAGYNMIRFIGGMPLPEQLALCDELGLMVYEENLASWWYAKTPHLPGAEERFNSSLREMILRDRNHPSVVIWGLLNENISPVIFELAKTCLPWVRKLDMNRMILLSSGRWDCDPSIGSVSSSGSCEWEHVWGIEGPNASGRLDRTDFNPNGGAYFSQSGDVHIYLSLPHQAEEKRRIRELGGTKPVFLSEYGVGSQFNAVAANRNFEAHHCRRDLADYSLFISIEDALKKDWARWNLEGLYPSINEFLEDSARKSVRERRRGFDYVRGNPWLCGWSVTSMLDGCTGEGFWTCWRMWKPQHADVLANGWAPLRWCLDVSRYHVFENDEIECEAVLANEDVLELHRTYQAIFRISGGGRLVWKKTVDFQIVEKGPMGEPALAQTILCEKIKADWAWGTYTFSAELLEGGDARDSYVDFWVAPPRKRLSLPDVACVTAGHLPLKFLPEMPAWNKDERNSNPMLILIGKLEEEQVTLEFWHALCEDIRKGSVAIFSSPDSFNGHGPDLKYGQFSSLNTQGESGIPEMAFYESDAEFWGNMDFVYSALPAGNYRIEAQFAELYHRQMGARVFDVSINGKKVLENYDVYAIAGYGKRKKERFDVTVQQGGTIEFKTTEKGTLSCLEIYDSLNELVFKLEPDHYRGCRRFPIPCGKNEVKTIFDTLYHKDCIFRPGTVFPDDHAGIADYDYYGDMLSHDFWICNDYQPDDVLAASFAAGYFTPSGYTGGIMLGAFKLGQGWFFVNTLKFSDENPASVQCFEKLLYYAADKIDRSHC